MRLSKFGEKFTRRTGIQELMEDLDAGLNGPEKLLMLGGGNPGRIPAVEQELRARMEQVLARGDEFERMVGIYDHPRGETEFLDELRGLLRRECGWDLGPENIALTNGSQNSFFFLFNLLAGDYADGSRKRILLPLAPEYIGYTDTSIAGDIFSARRPRIELLDDHDFKYRVDFDDFSVGEDIAAICFSRPTNPSGNVMTDEEVHRLGEEARKAGVPLIIDNAYGLPFPGLVYTEASAGWDENTILTMSLSKLGIPAARTGIVIARAEIIQALASLNAVVNLSCGSLGPVLARELTRTGKIMELSRDVLRPHYETRMHDAAAHLHACMDPALEYRVHAREGAFFLWLWFKDLPIRAAELYERLKGRGVIVAAGHYFFPGLEEDWRHKQECIRVSCAQAEADVKAGLAIIAEEVRRVYGEA